MNKEQTIRTAGGLNIERSRVMKRTSHIVALDAMRGLAAIVVAVGHFFFGFAPQIHGLIISSSGFPVKSPV